MHRAVAVQSVPTSLSTLGCIVGRPHQATLRRRAAPQTESTTNAADSRRGAAASRRGAAEALGPLHDPRKQVSRAFQTLHATSRVGEEWAPYMAFMASAFRTLHAAARERRNRVQKDSQRREGDGGASAVQRFAKGDGDTSAVRVVARGEGGTSAVRVVAKEEGVPSAVQGFAKGEGGTSAVRVVAKGEGDTIAVRVVARGDGGTSAVREASAPSHSTTLRLRASLEPRVRAPKPSASHGNGAR